MSSSNSTALRPVSVRPMPVLAGAQYAQIRSALLGTVTDEAINARALKLTTEKLASDVRARCAAVADLTYYNEDPKNIIELLGLAKAAMAEFTEFIKFRQELVASLKVEDETEELGG